MHGGHLSYGLTSPKGTVDGVWTARSAIAIAIAPFIPGYICIYIYMRTYENRWRIVCVCNECTFSAIWLSSKRQTEDKADELSSRLRIAVWGSEIGNGGGVCFWALLFSVSCQKSVGGWKGSQTDRRSWLGPSSFPAENEKRKIN